MAMVATVAVAGTLARDGKPKRKVDMSRIPSREKTDCFVSRYTGSTEKCAGKPKSSKCAMCDKHKNFVHDKYRD